MSSPVPTTGFHHVAIKVARFEEAVAFYKKGLNFTEKVSWGEGDGRAVMMDAGNGNYVEIFAGGKEETPSEGRVIHLAVRSENCDASLAQAVAAGAVVTVEPKDVTIQNPAYPVPVRIAFCRSPSGEVIEFFQNSLI